MASKAVIDAVEARLAANWTRTPVVSLNRGQEPQDGTAFLRATYVDPRERQFTLGDPGNNVWKEEGTIRLVLEAKNGIGAEQAATWCDELAVLFRGQYFAGVQCFEAVSPPFDNATKGNYYELPVRVRFTYFRNG